MTIGEYPLYIVPLDEDVLSFELDLGFKVSFLLPALVVFLNYAPLR